MKKIDIIGERIASLNICESGIKEISIIHVVDEYRPKGPAENSILYLTVKLNKTIHACYIPWVGYFDIDRENIVYPKKWKIWEPSKKIEYKNVLWDPFLENQS